MVDNPDSLLDVSDLVFIDMPGTGFGRLIGKDRAKPSGAWIRTRTRLRASLRVSREVRPVELAEVHLWRELRNDAVGGAGRMLENDKNIDMNGVILLSQIFNFTIGHRREPAAIPAWTCRTSWHCRPSRPRRGTTRNFAATSPRWSRS